MSSFTSSEGPSAHSDVGRARYPDEDHPRGGANAPNDVQFSGRAPWRRQGIFEKTPPARRWIPLPTCTEQTYRTTRSVVCRVYAHVVRLRLPQRPYYKNIDVYTDCVGVVFI